MFRALDEFDISPMDDANRLSEREGLKCILLLFFDKKIPFPLLISYIGNMSTGRVAFFYAFCRTGFVSPTGFRSFHPTKAGITSWS